jgi:hypothetical protein
MPLDSLAQSAGERVSQAQIVSPSGEHMSEQTTSVAQTHRNPVSRENLHQLLRQQAEQVGPTVADDVGHRASPGGGMVGSLSYMGQRCHSGAPGATPHSLGAPWGSGSALPAPMS